MQRQLVASIPLWFRVLYGVVLFGWSLGELATYINSYEGRALHDLVAGTVVVYKIPRVVGSLIDNPPVSSTSAYR